MEPRVNLFENKVTASYVKRLTTAGKVAEGSGLPAATYELVKIRASQINGCAMCLDMHTKDALHAGETSLRINLIAAWREATVFTEAERAALELTEAGTRLADGGGVSEDTWQRVRKHYDEDQIGGLLVAIATINAWNRLNAIAHTPAGNYEPGMF
ncbi:carboxymuconolactone decarboxylase family protein [Nocardia jinanensis]|uniref:Alkyl hydroperoxide reductase AhpD n=1 Tax=Nocardia jinanensis TaxID=382504 RepID=A0A917VWI4_9NOCA|nr:carboxymuconolactone decarboxylase family protein [Nocardia jinanensis]GGL21496.1 alkyl hydroperoxide reductase AhpD [Nocardia jinanensis]